MKKIIVLLHISILIFNIFLFININSQIILKNKKILSIEEAAKSDIDSILELIEELGFSSSYEILEKKFDHYLSGNDKIWIAKVNNKIVGFIAINILNPFYSPNLFARIDSIIVNNNNRRLGIGRALINTAEQYAKNLGCNRIFLTSGNHRIEAHEFYKHLNFQSNATYFVKNL